MCKGVQRLSGSRSNETEKRLGPTKKRGDKVSGGSSWTRMQRAVIVGPEGGKTYKCGRWGLYLLWASGESPAKKELGKVGETGQI